MKNVEIAHLLNKYADLLEIQGADLFRIQAYRIAARTIESLSQSVTQLLEAGKDLRKLKLPRIGKSMSEHIEEIVKTGTLTASNELRKKLPGKVDESLEVEGLGPKRTKQLYEKLGISSIEKTEGSDRVRETGISRRLRQKKYRENKPGDPKFRKTTQALQTLGRRPVGAPSHGTSSQGGAIEQIEVAGSYRRRMETVGDIDILVASDKPKTVMQCFQTYPEIERVLAAGTTRGTIILRSGLQVDLRILPRRSYGAALHYFTESKAHTSPFAPSASSAACVSANTESSVSRKVGRSRGRDRIRRADWRRQGRRRL